MIFRKTYVFFRKCADLCFDGSFSKGGSFKVSVVRVTMDDAIGSGSVGDGSSRYYPRSRVEGWKWSVGFDLLNPPVGCAMWAPPQKKNRPFWAEIWHPFPEGVGWCFWNPALLCHLSARQPCLKSVACCPGAAAAGWSSIHHVNILLTRDPSRLKLVYFSTFISKLRFVWLDLYKMHPGNLT